MARLRASLLLASVWCLATPVHSQSAPRAEAASDQSAIQLVRHGDVSLAVAQFGPRDGKPILLISGTGQQLIDWPEALIDGLVADGRRVIVFDNRDAGASTHFTEAGIPDFGAVFAAAAQGGKLPLPYEAMDMVADARAVLEALSIQRADILGVSGGATVGALLTAQFPDVVTGLVLVMSNSGNPALPLPAEPARLAGLPPPALLDRAGLVAARVATERALANDDEGFNEEAATHAAERAIARDADPFGSVRQGAALLVLGDLRSRFSSVQAPTIVIHGDRDPLISDEAGREVAASIPGAQFVLVEGVGHTLDPKLIPHLIDASRALDRTAPSAP